MRIRRIHFLEECLKEFDAHCAQYREKETGGVLLGRLVNETMIVTTISGPGPNAIHEPLYFKADKNYIDMVIDLEFANSEGGIVYLGEWHTHPQVKPYPSEQDLSSLSEIAFSAQSPKILLILGAINFSIEKARQQSIVILKHPEKEEFIQYPFELN